MTQLTTERFEEILTAKLEASEKRVVQQVVQRIDEAQEDLARMVKHGFDDVLERLDVRERVTKVESDLQRIAEALHITL
jgi:hypothetical protein